MTKLYCELFCFNKNSDYLPYYKKNYLKIDEKLSLLDLLNTIDEKEPFGLDRSKNISLKINNLYFNSSTSIDEVIKLSGKEWKIEPISTYRATKDFIIDNSDFVEKLSILKEYMTYSMFQYYLDEYELYYYASNSINYNRDYIGDHVLYAAYDIIQKDPSKKNDILKLITDRHSSIIYHTSLKNRIYNFDTTQENKIKELFTMSNLTYIDIEYLDILSEKCVDIFKEFNITSYMPTQNSINSIKNSGANYIDLASSYQDIALHTIKSNPNFTFKLCGEFLLDAKDNSTDLVIVDDKLLEIFDKNQKLIEQSVGREINLPIITKTQFLSILSGNKDYKALGLDKHRVKLDW